jgi:hypothetical protein
MIASAVRQFGHGFIILCGMLILIMCVLCMFAAWASTQGRDGTPKAMVVAGWILTGIAACLLTGWVWWK